MTFIFVRFRFKNGREALLPSHALHFDIRIEKEEGGDRYVYSVSNVYTGQMLGTMDGDEFGRVLAQLSEH